MRSELAEKFGERSLQYFNTVSIVLFWFLCMVHWFFFLKYGGNPVSAAVANAVLDVIENEKLYQHVTDVSTHLLKELNRLKDKHSIIGDIR